MTLFFNLPAKIKLDARTLDGQRVETDTLTAAEYSLLLDGINFLTKTIGNGLSIENDDSGEGFLYVTFDENELGLIGKYKQRLKISNDCSGQMFGATVRPELLYVKE